jgi:hypothetical protein
MTHILIPRTPSMNLLRPFIECPTSELDQAWAAMVRIAEVQHARAGSQCLAQPVLYVSPGQLANHSNPEGPESEKAGRYLPARVTPAGKFTQPLYAGEAPATVEPRARDLLGIVRTAQAEARRLINGEDSGSDLAQTKLDLPETLRVLEHALSQPAAVAGPALDVTLDEDQAGLLRDMLGDPAEYEEALTVRLIVCDGHRGHGLYVAQAEYQDEGAALLAPLPAPAAPTAPQDWRIDTSTGRGILVYKNCSVIEAEQAPYVLGLIAADAAAAHAPALEAPAAARADLLVTVTMQVARGGNITSDIQTHDNSYADVATGLAEIKREIERVFREKYNCPHYPKNVQEAHIPIVRHAAGAWGTAAPAVDARDPALPSWWPDFIQCVAELPDRNSPEDEPDAMIATAEELGACAIAAQAKEGGEA